MRVQHYFGVQSPHSLKLHMHLVDTLNPRPPFPSHYYEKEKVSFELELIGMNEYLVIADVFLHSCYLSIKCSV